MNNNKKVYIGMSADIMHHGLVNIIKEGAKYGSVVIGLLTDKAISEYKRLPFQDYEKRKVILESFKDVSEVVVQEQWDYVPNLRKLKPDYMIHGDDWCSGSQKVYRDKAFAAMEEWGGKIIEIPYTKDASSSLIGEEIRQRGVSQSSRQGAFRRLLEAKDILRVIEVHHGLSGLIAEKAKVSHEGKELSFDAMWSSSLTDSTAKGKPDIEAVDLTARMFSVNEIFEVTTKPMIYDGDTGGKLEHFPFMVKTLERTGVSAVVIEDKIGLKKNSLFGNDVQQEQDDIQSFCYKLEAGRKAKVSDGFMIFARIESLILEKGMDDAVERALAYIEAGADGIMIHSRKKDPSEIFEFCQRRRNFPRHVPLIVVPTSFNQVREKEFAEAGVQIVIYANHLLRSSYPAMLKTAETILRNQRSLEADDLCLGIKEILELIPGTK